MINFKNIALGLLIIIPFFYSCKDEGDGISGLLDKDDVLSVYKDSSTTIKLRTEYDNGIITSKFTYMLGSFLDNEIGQTKASFMTRFYYDSVNRDMKDVKLKNISFKMYDTSYYIGNLDYEQEYNIYELKEHLTPEHFEAYYNNGKIPSDIINSAYKIGTASYTPQADSGSVFTYDLPSVYEEELFERLQNAYIMDTSKFVIDSLLVNEFKGLFITTDFQDAAVVRFFSPEIAISATYKNEDCEINLVPSPIAWESEDKDDSSKVYLQSLSFFEHKFKPEIESIIGKDDQTTHYVKGYAGLKTVLSFDDLEQWRDSNVVINAVQIQIPIQNLNETYHTYPDVLNLRVYDKDDELVQTTLSHDFDSTRYLFSSPFFTTYIFNNDDHTSEYKFEVTVPDNNLYGERVMLNAINPDELKFVITYSK